MADLRNCKRCGRLFNYIGGNPICSSCKDEDEADFQKVKKYLYENPGATISQVTSSLDISVEQIKKYLKEERLEIVGDDGIFTLLCEKCQKPIHTGRFCETCSRELTVGLSSAAKNITKSSNYINSQGLRYLSRNKDAGKANESKKGFGK